jgi:uncharacterized repeat protein (TIGR03803 family)
MLTPNSTLTALHSFAGPPADGAYPVGGLLQSTDGSFYGTTAGGGANHNCLYNCGTIYRINPRREVTTLYSFCPLMRCPDGGWPYATLVEGTDGDFYGTTSRFVADNNGTVFKITPRGELMTLYSFCPQVNCAKGANPDPGVIQASDGNFYGTTNRGGAHDFGEIFKITPAGEFTLLHSFAGPPDDGAYPIAGVVQGADGNLYGTTAAGGGAQQVCQYGCGTVFRITLNGKETILHRFCSLANCADGFFLEGGLVQATDGNLYGASLGGGINRSSSGTLFKITPKGELTTLYSFCSQTGCPDGKNPSAGLVQGTDGSFYGTAAFGGNTDCPGGCGTVFRLSVGLPPFVKTLPTSGEVGAKVIILGTDLGGATSVSFERVAAQFTVVSKSEIKAVVPAGANTGKVRVKTPHGALVSNVAFHVTP